MLQKKTLPEATILAAKDEKIPIESVIHREKFASATRAILTHVLAYSNFFSSGKRGPHRVCLSISILRNSVSVPPIACEINFNIKNISKRATIEYGPK